MNQLFTKRINFYLFKSKSKSNFYLLCLTLLSLALVYFQFRRKIENFSADFENELLLLEDHLNVKLINVKPTCKCKKDILVKKYYDKFYVFETSRKHLIYYNSTNSSHKFYEEKLEYLKKFLSIKSEDVHVNPKFTCNLYNELAHGPNQKVIGYSLYGQNDGYYKLIKIIAKQSQHLFSDWIIRIHYDNSINKAIICETECMFEHVYFCNVNKLPFANEVVDAFSWNNYSSLTNDFGYVHGMMWRWFPISDDFVDYFSSRDTDSNLIQREKDSVDAWLKGNKLFHIIRDNPYHNIQILGGLWGHANIRRRQSGYEVFNEFIKPSIQEHYNIQKANPKNSDQSYLLAKVWPSASKNATIHDAYNCRYFGPSEPFPTQRPPNMYCFVSCFYPCCDEKYNQTQRMPVCPEQCRPKEHQDWERC